MNFRPEGNLQEEILSPTDTQIAWEGSSLTNEDLPPIPNGIETKNGIFIDDGFGDSEPSEQDFRSIAEVRADLLARGINPDQFNFDFIDESLQGYSE